MHILKVLNNAKSVKAYRLLRLLYAKWNLLRPLIYIILNISVYTYEYA